MRLLCQYPNCQFNAKNIAGKLSHERSCKHKLEVQRVSPKNNVQHQEMKTNPDEEEQMDLENKKSETDAVEFYDSINGIIP